MCVAPRWSKVPDGEPEHLLNYMTDKWYPNEPLRLPT